MRPDGAAVREARNKSGLRRGAKSLLLLQHLLLDVLLDVLDVLFLGVLEVLFLRYVSSGARAGGCPPPDPPGEAV